MNENKTKASQIDKHLKYNNQVSYNIYNVDQMAEKINRIKSDNINNNNNKLSLIDDTIVAHDNINYSKIRHRYKLLSWIFKKVVCTRKTDFLLVRCRWTVLLFCLCVTDRLNAACVFVWRTDF